MLQRPIDPGNFREIIETLKLHAEEGQLKLVDFSKTDFRPFLASHISELFTVLSLSPQPIKLILKFCRFEEKNFDETNPEKNQFSVLISGLMTTKNIYGFEFVRSISPACPKELSDKILLTIAQGIVQSPHIKHLTLDSFRVIPQFVCDLLKQHLQNLELNLENNSSLLFFANGLLLRTDARRPLSDPQYSRSRLFPPASNEADLRTFQPPLTAVKNRRGSSG